MMMMIPIEVTLVGIVTDVSDLQKKKAISPNSRVGLVSIRQCGASNDDSIYSSSSSSSSNDDDNTDSSDSSRNSNGR